MLISLRTFSDIQYFWYLTLYCQALCSAMKLLTPPPPALHHLKMNIPDKPVKISYRYFENCECIETGRQTILFIDSAVVLMPLVSPQIIIIIIALNVCIVYFICYKDLF